MASNGGVRTCMASTPVPSPTPGAAHDAAPSTENASMPVTSATQNESYPRRSARLATSTTAAVPERINGAAVTPSGLPPADAAGASDDGAVSMTATMRLASGDVWRESDQVIRPCGGPAVAFGRRAPRPVRPQSPGPAGYAEMAPPRPLRPSGVATSSTLVPPRACSPRTPATASVSPATSRAAISLPPGRVRAASRMPNVIAGAASSTALPPTPQRPRRDAVEMDDDQVAGPLAVHLDDGIGQGGDQRRLAPGELRLGYARRQVWHSRDLRLFPKRI